MKCTNSVKALVTHFKLNTIFIDSATVEMFDHHIYIKITLINNWIYFKINLFHWALPYRFSLLVLHEIWDRCHAKRTQTNAIRPIKFINQFRQFIWHNPVKCVSQTHFAGIHSISASAWEISIFENISNVFSILNSFPEKNRDDKN